MRCFRESLILSALLRLWDRLRTTYRNGLICRFLDAADRLLTRLGEKLASLWDRVWILFQNGALYRMGAWLSARFRNGLLRRLLTRRGALARAFDGSLVRQRLEKLLMLPALLLRKLFGRRVSALSALGACSLPVCCLLLLLLLVTPQGHWNNLYSLAFSLLLFFLCSCAAAAKEEKALSLRHIGVWGLLFALVVLLSALWSFSPKASFRFLLFAVTCMLVVLVFPQIFDSGRRLNVFLLTMAVGLLVASLCAFYQKAQGIAADAELADLSLNADLPGRVYSFFENPNSFASVLVFFAPLMLCMGLFSPKRWHRLLCLFSFVCASAALFLTYSRGAWLAYVFALFLLLCLLCPRWLPLAAAVILLVIPFLPGTVFTRLVSAFGFADTSNYIRAFIYVGMFRLIVRHPLFGVGLGAEAVREQMTFPDIYRSATPFVHGHNLYLQLWAESGVFALLSFLPLVCSPLRRAVRVLRGEECPAPLRGILAGSAAGLAGALVFGLSDYPWSYPRVMLLFWLLFGTLKSALSIHDQSEKAGVSLGE